MQSLEILPQVTPAQRSNLRLSFSQFKHLGQSESLLKMAPSRMLEAVILD